MLVFKFMLYCFAFQYPATFLSLFSVELLLYIEVNKVNECNKKRLFSITREFTEILKKYLHQLQIDEGRDIDVYPF